MASEVSETSGPDLEIGISFAGLGDRKLVRGHVGDSAVLLVRMGDELVAVGAHCTHYGGQLADGLVSGETIRCPLHHACFSLRTGEALNAPAIDPIPCWRVERQGDLVRVVEPLPAAVRSASQSLSAGAGDKIVIIGGGASGFACAEMLRRRGWDGSLTLLSDDSSPPVDRPNLSKDYLAGSAPEEWMPLRPAQFYSDQMIDLRLDTHASRIDVAGRTVLTDDGRTWPFDQLLIATGAEPIRPSIPGQDQGHVFTLRSMADSRAIIAQARNSRSAVVLGSGFIGLETAAALRARGLDVHVVSLDQRPLGRVLGDQLGDFIRLLHESEGVIFHLESSLAAIGTDRVTLSDGSQLPADLVILGTGVRPRQALAEAAGIAVGQGILVDQYLETSVAGIYAAGDVARWRELVGGQSYRVEHWVVAERQGQVVAQNMLGVAEPYLDSPFFWSTHYGVTIRYCGHAQPWDRIEVEGSIPNQDCRVSYIRAGTTVAIATMGRDLEALEFAEQGKLRH